MYCIHCKHCSDDIICLPANVSSEPVSEHQRDSPFNNESLTDPIKAQLPANDVAPPVVTVPDLMELVEEPPAPHEVARVRTRLKTPPSLKYYF